MENNGKIDTRPHNCVRPLSKAAQDALSEAKARKEAQIAFEEKLIAQKSKEKLGPKREPTRFADWEKNGRAIDF